MVGAVVVGVAGGAEEFEVVDDGFALWLNNLLDSRLGPTAAAAAKFRFDAFPTGTVCRVDVTPGDGPTFLSGTKGEADLYVRLNNATRLLNTAEALTYVRTRWP